MNIEEIQELLTEYKQSDIFRQNDIAIQFIERYGEYLLSVVKKCNCDMNKKETVDFLFDRLKKDLIATLKENKESIMNERR